MNPIVEKIKKLLRMQRGGTPDEIATALKLAQELADKHGIDLGSVDPTEKLKSEQIGQSDTGTPISRIQWECTYASLICKHFFKVEVIERNTAWRKYVLTFIGTAWDIEVALYVYHFLVGHFRREWTHKSGRCRNRQSFMFGMYCGLAQKLRERIPQEVKAGSGQEVMVIAGQVARRDYIAKHFGKLTTKNAAPDSDAAKAKWLGFLAGQDTEIRPAVKPAEGRPMLS